MNKELIQIKFKIQPLSCINILPHDTDRRYFLISNSTVSQSEFYVLFYSRDSLVLTANEILQIQTDGLGIYPAGYLEPNMVPINAISIANITNNAVLTGLILY